MATIDPTYRNADAHGMPLFEAHDDYIQSFLLAGTEPGLMPTRRILLGDSVDLAQFSVVGINSSGKLVLAQWNAVLANAIIPVGVLAHQVASGASNTTIFGEVWLTGVFNAGPDSPLVWHATFDTEAKKLAYNQANPNLIFRVR